jgi:hypothetical protein
MLWSRFSFLWTNETIIPEYYHLFPVPFLPVTVARFKLASGQKKRPSAPGRAEAVFFGLRRGKSGMVQAQLTHAS